MTLRVAIGGTEVCQRAASAAARVITAACAADSLVDEVSQPRKSLLAFFSFFAARFSIRFLAGFFLRSFLVSFALLMADSRAQAVRRTVA
jgi:hypothetical protein